MSDFYERIGQCHAKLKRNKVWCHTCGYNMYVNSAECFQQGWPKCCDQTMSLDSPEEHAKLGAEKKVLDNR